jgi:hypothetical protein
LRREEGCSKSGAERFVPIKVRWLASVWFKNSSYLRNIGDVLSLLDLTLLVHDFSPIRQSKDGVCIFQCVSQG